jgi:hypothetical protein
MNRLKSNHVSFHSSCITTLHGKGLQLGWSDICQVVVQVLREPTREEHGSVLSISSDCLCLVVGCPHHECVGSPKDTPWGLRCVHNLDGFFSVPLAGCPHSQWKQKSSAFVSSSERSSQSQILPWFQPLPPPRRITPLQPSSEEKVWAIL